MIAFVTVNAFESPVGCTASDDNGRPCTQPAVAGDRRCAGHWGTGRGYAARRIRNLAARVAERENDMKHDFSRDLAKYGPPIVVDPGVALLGEVHRTAGHVAYLERRVRELEESELVWSKVMESREEGQVPGGGGGGGGTIDVLRTEHRQEINKWWQLYMSERKHLAQVSLAALKAGIEERRVRLAERGVDILEDALSNALTELGLDPSSERVRAVLGHHLAQAVDANVFGTRSFVVDGDAQEEGVRLLASATGVPGEVDF